jgi:predicted phage terminase large subunit-like protein
MSVTLDAHDEEALRRIASNWRLTPATLAHKLSGGRWIPAAWLMYVSQVIAQAIARGDGRIIISAPPRHGKSKLIDVYTPVWILENFPEHHVILASYGADLSEDFGREVRDILADNPDLLRAKLRPDATRVDDFKTTGGGGMVSRGLGGAITGKGANVLLIDDYIKEIKEALSPTYRDYIWNWFTTTAYTRLEPGGTCIIIATRWHSDDLIGRILKAFPGQWTNIVLPAVAEKNDLLGRPPGTPLFPERYPLKVLMERLEVLGSSFFQALFQQRPLDEAKKLSDAAWLRIVDIVPAKLKCLRVWDLAATEGGGDYTVGALCGYDTMTGYFYILNIVRGQWSPAEVEKKVLATAVSDGLETGIVIEQETGSSGKALVEHYSKTVLPEFTVTPEPVNKNKVLRAQPMLAGAEAGKVYLLTGGWNKDFINEFDVFPGQYDDQIDAVAMAYTRLTGRKLYTATWGREPTGKAWDIRSKGKIQRAAQFNLARNPSVTWGR